MKYINIKFPFKESSVGFFVELTKVDDDAIKSDLLHLILTRKGQRLYNPDFGTRLLEYIFEPNDKVTLDSIKQEISTTLSKYLPMVTLNELSVVQSDSNEHISRVKIEYSITDDVFTKTDFVVIDL